MTTLSGVETTGDSLTDAAEDLMSRWQDASSPSDTDNGNPDPAASSEDEDEEATLLRLASENDENADPDSESSDEEQSDTTDTTDDANTPEAGDDHRVSITVDGETQTVTVKELKRLFGQEASLTRKSQEVAAARKDAEADAERYMVAAQRLISKAERRFEPFAKMDWMVAQQRLEPSEFAVLREEAREAYADLEFLKSEADDVLSQVTRDRQEKFNVAAKEAIEVLVRDIPGWNREVYEQVRAHAVETGMAPEVVNTVIDPAAIKMMYDAMLYRQLKAKAAAKKTTVKAAPKKVVQPTAKVLSNQTKGKDNEALTRLTDTGSRDDAVAAFMGRWADDGRD